MRPHVNTIPRHLGRWDCLQSTHNRKNLLGKDEHSNNQDNRPGKLHCNRNTVASSIISIFGCVQHNGCEKETNRNSPLVAANDGTSNPFWCRLGLV